MIGYEAFSLDSSQFSKMDSFKSDKKKENNQNLIKVE